MFLISSLAEAFASVQVGTVIKVSANEIVVQAADESGGETGQAAYLITPETRYRNARDWYDIKFGYLVEIDYDNSGSLKTAQYISVEMKRIG